MLEPDLIELFVGPLQSADFRYFICGSLAAMLYSEPPVGWPWGDVTWEARFRKWESEYTKVAGQFATCSLLGQFGYDEFHPDLSELIQLHDAVAQVGTELRLA